MIIVNGSHRQWYTGVSLDGGKKNVAGFPIVCLPVVRRMMREKRGLCVRGNITCDYQGLDKVNGRKVNGIDGNGGPYLGSRRIGFVNENSGDGAIQAYKLGRFVENGFVYRQTFVIRSYEIGPDKTATMETVMNLLQETALNHVTSSGLASDGFGATHEMSIRKLIWVVTRINVRVERYSRWGDVIEIDTWVAASGKNGMRRDWIIRDCRTQQIITKATSTWVIMNRETRKLSKIPEQVRKEVEPYYLERRVIDAINNSNKIDKLNDETAEFIRSGLASVPMNVLEDYNLTSMTLEYRRECRQSNLLESLTSMKVADTKANQKSASSYGADLGSTHLLRMQEDKAEIVRARAKWQSKKQLV